jgi:hypothetical protein
MFANLKYNLTHNWTTFRVMRMILAAIALGQWIVAGDMIMGLAGLFIGYQAVANISCAGGNCYSPNTKKNYEQATETIQFEEIK